MDKLFIILFVGISFIISAQNPKNWNEYFNYEKELENAHQKKYFASLHLTGMEMSSNDILRIPAEIKVFVNPIKPLWLEASYSKIYFSLQQFLQKDCESCENKYKTYGKFEAGGRFSFYDKLRSKNEKIALSSKQVGNTIYTKYAVYKIPKRKVIAARGGFYALNHMVSSTWVYENENTQVFLNERFTNYKNQGVYLGFSTSTIVNTSFKTDRGSDMSVGYFKDFYLDAMFSLNEYLDPFIVQGKTVKSLLNSSDNYSFVTDNLGFRFGFNQLIIRKLVGMTMNIELGYHPGIKNNLVVPALQRRMYAGFKFGISFSK
jgi:hypothetical protein